MDTMEFLFLRQWMSHRANAILSIMQDHSLYQKLKENGKEYYNAHLAYDDSHHKLEKIYQNIVTQ